MIDSYAANLAWTNREARVDYALGPLMDIGIWADDFIARNPETAVPTLPAVYESDLEFIVKTHPPTPGYDSALSTLQHYQYSTSGHIQCRVSHRMWVPLPGGRGVVAVDTLLDHLRAYVSRSTAPVRDNPKPAPEQPAKLRHQFNNWMWPSVFIARPYKVIGQPDWNYRWDSFTATAEEWLRNNQEWLISTYDIAADKWLSPRVATAISDIERDRARALGLNVGS